MYLEIVRFDGSRYYVMGFNDRDEMRQYADTVMDTGNVARIELH